MKATQLWEFEFEGKPYKAWGNILGGFLIKNKYFNWKKTIPYSSHKNFYEVAKKHKASCDIFLCLEDMNLYIPLNDCLALVDKEVLNSRHFKGIEKYKRWYH